MVVFMQWHDHRRKQISDCDRESRMDQMQSETDNQEQPPLIALLESMGAYTSSVAEELRIDSEFQFLIPPLSKGEKAALQASILKEGCRDRLSVWAEEKLLIDGHNRYSICTAHSIPYKIVEMSFDSRNAVKVWIIANQLGRRSLTPESVSYLRGTWYELTKQSRGGDRKSNCQNDRSTDKTARKSNCQNDSLTDKTARELGEQFKTSPRTIYRDAKFTQAVDALSSIGGEDVKWKILTRSAGLTKKEVLALAIDARTRPAKVAKTLQERCRTVKPEGKPAIAHHLTFKAGSLVEVYAPDREDVNGKFGRIQSVGEKTATVWMRHTPILTMHLYTFKHSALTTVPLESQPGLQEICDRTDRLYKLGNLDPFEVEILNLLERATTLTPTELQYLAHIENRHNFD